MSIREIFNKRVKDILEILKKKITLDLINQKISIISLGGGGFINKKIQKTILSKCVSYWLNWDSVSIIDRIKNSKKRPLLKNLNENQISNLLFERSKIYKKADHEINCEKLSREDIIRNIISKYECE